MVTLGFPSSNKERLSYFSFLKVEIFQSNIDIQFLCTHVKQFAKQIKIYNTFEFSRESWEIWPKQGSSAISEFTPLLTELSLQCEFFAFTITYINVCKNKQMYFKNGKCCLIFSANQSALTDDLSQPNVRFQQQLLVVKIEWLNVSHAQCSIATFNIVN